MTSPFAFEALADQDRSRLSCGTEALDRYFRIQAGQDVRRRMATCYLAVERETHEVVGFYTLAMSAVPLLDLPEALGRKLPRYPLVPAALLGRLAVDLRFRGRGVGGAMVSDALERTRGSGVAAYALVVDAKDDAAVAFYRHHGFVELSGGALFVPLSH